MAKTKILAMDRGRIRLLDAVATIIFAAAFIWRSRSEYSVIKWVGGTPTERVKISLSYFKK